MKKIFLLLLFPLLGVNKKADTVRYVPVKRPTLEQQLQLSKNRLEVSNSQFYVELAELKNEQK